MDNVETLKYKKISNFFLKEIKSGKYSLGKKLPSERSLARQYNLSHMTVNKALNGLVATGLLERRQGDGTYVKAYALPKTACLILDYMDDIHAVFPYIIQKVLFDAGFITTVFDTIRISKMPEMLKAYFSNPCDLLIFDGLTNFPFDILEHIPEITRKIIFHRCETKPVFNASYVLTDTEKCGYIAVKQLVLSGRQHIGIVSEISKNKYSDATFFRKGCERALADFNIKNAIFLEREPVWGHEDKLISEGEALEILQDNSFDGILSLMDSEIIPFVKAANKLGIKIPEQLFLIGRYNTPWANDYNLTSIDIQPHLIAESIKSILNSEENTTIMIAPEIVFRGSCPKEK